METILGIDLGTTNCSVTAIDGDGKTRLIKNKYGEFITPSAVYFSKTKDGMLIGKPAKEMSNVDPENLVLFVKREMGKDKNKVRYNEIEDRYRPYKFYGKIFSPQEISAMILKQLKQDAENELGYPIKKAVITCPAYFGDAEKEATMAAGKIAGFEVLEILPEPTAAALAYSAVSKKGNETVLVFDLGGGTFDVTILKIIEGEKGRAVECLKTDGNHKLGGKDWDDCIKDYLVECFDEENGINLDYQSDNAITFGKLRIDVEKAKVELFKNGVAEVPVSIEYGGKKLTKLISRDLFKNKTRRNTDRCRTYCTNILNDAELTWDDIDTVLMVGNMSNCITIQDALKSWSGKDINFGLVNPKTCVSEGAAIKGFLLEGGVTVSTLDDEKIDASDFSQQQEMIEKVDEMQETGNRTEQDFFIDGVKSGVLPASIGIKVLNRNGDEVIFKFFNKNDKYPISYKRAFPPKNSGEPELSIDVYEGEGTSPDDCKFVGTAVVQLDGKLTKDDKLDILLSKDTNGILQIEATNLRTGIHMVSKIEREGAASDEEIKKSSEEIEEFFLG